MSIKWYLGSVLSVFFSLGKVWWAAHEFFLECSKEIFLVLLFLGKGGGDKVRLLVYTKDRHDMDFGRGYMNGLCETTTRYYGRKYTDSCRNLPGA